MQKDFAIDESKLNESQLTLSAKMGIAIGSQHLKRSVFDCKECHIECSASKIVYENVGFLASLVHSKSNGCGCWLVDDTLHVQTSNGTSILREDEDKPVAVDG